MAVAVIPQGSVATKIIANLDPYMPRAAHRPEMGLKQPRAAGAFLALDQLALVVNISININSNEP